jgi:hypothetical protein
MEILENPRRQIHNLILLIMFMDIDELIFCIEKYGLGHLRNFWRGLKVRSLHWDDAKMSRMWLGE